MNEQQGLNRRSVLQAGALLASSALLRPGLVWATVPTLAMDFRGSVPPGVSFQRSSAASLVTGQQVRMLPDNTPRFPVRGTVALGLLIEGATTNLVENASRPDSRDWSKGTAVTVSPSNVIAPDGSANAFRIVRGEPKSGSLCEVTVNNASNGDFVSASVWLRSTSGSGKWRLRLLDYSTYNNINNVVAVTPEWRRYSLTLNLQTRDSGAKRFAVLWNEPFGAVTAAPAIYALKPASPYEPGRTPLTLSEVLMWGVQYETGNEASSFVATSGAPAHRAADEVTFSATPLSAPSARLTIVLPDGGRRGGVILDANGDAGGLRLEYSNSGWMVARVGTLVLTGFTDTSVDPVIRLEWSASGVQIFSGKTNASLVLRAAVNASPLPIHSGAVARLGMTLDGLRPLGRVLAQLTLTNEVTSVTRVVLPNFIPATYRMVFGDDFDDPDLTRINENATGGRPGAPAWRSRYRHERKTVINKEKQIYMDPQYAGTARQPLQVQPFSIRNGVLQISAARADPVTVSPFIWNYRYTSGCITSELTHWQTYGYFEMRARLPRGKGFWPAFWLLPKRTTWPPEIDIFEASGTRPYGIKHGAIERPRSATTAAGVWIDQVIDSSDGFHIYGMEWTQENIVFFIDGIKSFEYGPHAIHEDMYLLANLALGSHDPNWIPDPDESTPFSEVFQIDYIRAYQRGIS